MSPSTDTRSTTRAVSDSVRAAEGDVALFGHGHALRVLAVRWCGLDPRSGRVLALDPATVSVLGYEHGNPVVRRWNEECDGA